MIVVRPREPKEYKEYSTEARPETPTVGVKVSVTGLLSQASSLPETLIVGVLVSTLTVAEAVAVWEI